MSPIMLLNPVWVEEASVADTDRPNAIAEDLGQERSKITTRHYIGNLRMTGMILV